MPVTKRVALTTAVAALALSCAPAAAVAARYEGRVVSVNRSAKTFRLAHADRGTIRIKVTRNTVFDSLAGFSSLRRGMTGIVATVRRSDGRWLAMKVERSGGADNHDHRKDD